MKKLIIATIAFATLSGCVSQENKIQHAYQFKDTSICFYNKHSADENTIARYTYQVSCNVVDERTLTVIEPTEDDIYDGYQIIKKIDNTEIEVETEDMPNGDKYISSVKRTHNYDVEIKQFGYFYNPNTKSCYVMNQSRSKNISNKDNVDCPTE